MRGRRTRQITENIAKVFIWMAAFFTISVMALIILQVLWEGIPVLSPHFLFESPRSMGREGGIFSTVVGTFALTIVAIIVATPLGVGTSIFLAEYTREGRISRVIRFGINCLAGVPSIIFGLFGFVFFVIYLNMGWSILAGALALSAMILPTVISTAEEAIKAVPHTFREVSFSLGGTRWQTVTRAVLPNALPGIFTGILLGICRCIEETAVVILTAGSSLILPDSLFSPVRTMSVHFYILAREGISMEMAYGTGAALILLVLFVNILANWLLIRHIRKKA
jgi:phosphate transport system permease protein